MPSSLKGGSDPSAHLETKSSLKKTAATHSHVHSNSKLKVAFQDVVEEQNPNTEIVEASLQPDAILAGEQGEPEQVGVQLEMSLQEQEVIESGVSLQEKEFQGEMDAPELDNQPQIGLQGQAPPVDELATLAALPQSSPAVGEPSTLMAIPLPTEPEKSPVFAHWTSRWRTANRKTRRGTSSKRRWLRTRFRFLPRIQCQRGR